MNAGRLTESPPFALFYVKHSSITSRGGVTTVVTPERNMLTSYQTFGIHRRWMTRETANRSENTCQLTSCWVATEHGWSVLAVKCLAGPPGVSWGATVQQYIFVMTSVRSQA